MQVCCGGDSNIGRRSGKRPEIVGVDPVETPDICHPVGHELCCHFAQFAGWITVGIFHDAFDIGVRIDACKLKHLAADIQQVPVGVLDQDLPISRDLIQV